MRRDVIVLGSTGSIGVQALDVIDDNPDRFRIVGLSAGGSDPRALADQVAATGARWAAVADPDAAEPLAAALAARGAAPEVLAGPEASAVLAARPADVVLNAITGAAGLPATLATLRAGSRLALANKESLVIGGGLVAQLAATDQITPVDSEHSAIAQCLRSGSPGEVARLVLTASGGPFRGWSAAALAAVTPEQALAHPTWDMGPVVTINSATLVNKGLELIEAHLLFGVPLDRIDVVVHPQSIVHSMVTFTDGSTVAQASPPDMRLPIALALGWPHRTRSKAAACDWSEPLAWTFEPLDEAVFPAVGVARRAGDAGGTAPAVFNAANEVGVAAFRAGRIQLPEIVQVAASIVDLHLRGVEGPGGGLQAPGTGSAWTCEGDLTVDAVTAADAWARSEAAAQVAAIAPWDRSVQAMEE